MEQNAETTPPDHACNETRCPSCGCCEHNGPPRAEDFVAHGCDYGPGCGCWLVWGTRAEFANDYPPVAEVLS